MTNPATEDVEIRPPAHSPLQLPENATLTEPRPEEEIRRAILDVVARVDRDIALDLVTVLQVQIRMAHDTGERLTLDEFAEETGWADELAQLRSE